MLCDLSLLVSILFLGAFSEIHGGKMNISFSGRRYGGIENRRVNEG
jgi:hypothetical protein